MQRGNDLRSTDHDSKVHIPCDALHKFVGYTPEYILTLNCSLILKFVYQPSKEPIVVSVGLGLIINLHKSRVLIRSSFVASSR